MSYLSVVMSHGHGDMKIVSSDGKLLDYYKDILRCVSCIDTKYDDTF